MRFDNEDVLKELVVLRKSMIWPKLKQYLEDVCFVNSTTCQAGDGVNMSNAVFFNEGRRSVYLNLVDIMEQREMLEKQEKENEETTPEDFEQSLL